MASTLTVNGQGVGEYDILNVRSMLTLNGQNVSALIGNNLSQIAGVRWDTSSSSPALVRVDRLGNTVTLTGTFFDLHPTWGRMRRCIMNDAGAVIAYQGDAGFEVLGATGQVMVEVPKFYYLVQDVGVYRYYWVSPAEAPGFKVHPMFCRDGVVSNYAYIGAFEASVYDVTAAATELDTITITAGASASGNLTVTLDGNYAFAVAVAASDTAEVVAGKIRSEGNKTDYQGVVWTVGGADADVTYTAGSTGLKTTVAVAAASTGVTTTIVKTTPGAGGYVLNNAAGVVTTATTGDKLCSIAGTKPATGVPSSGLSLPGFRTIAQNRGAGWGLSTFNQMAGIELLYLIEYATFASQAALSVGVTNITDDTTSNMAVNTGYTAGVGVGASNLANASGQVSINHYQTAQATTPMTYRGIENWYGNLNTWADGINIKADRNPWIADHDFASDLFAHPYADSGLALATASGYPTALVNVPALDYAFLPATAGAGSATEYTCDSYYQATGNKAAAFGGDWHNAAMAGAFFWYLNNTATTKSRYIGARLSFAAAPAATLEAGSVGYYLTESVAKSDIVPASGYATIPTGAADTAIPEGGRFFLSNDKQSRIRQAGSVTGLRIYATDLANMVSLTVAIWRKNGAVWDLVGSEDILSKLTGGQITTVTLTTPIAVRTGDYIGVGGIPAAGGATPFTAITGAPADASYALDGAMPIISTNWAAGTTSTSWVPIEVRMQAPNAVCIGDSVSAGHPANYSYIEATKTANPASDLAELLVGATGCTAQNMGIGGQNSTEILARFAADAVALKPRLAVIVAALNDLADSATQATYIANMIAMLDLCMAGGIVPVVLGLPWTNGTDEQMAEYDAWILALRSVLAGYPLATYVDARQYVGQYRATGPAGNLWDIKTAYNSDGVHYNAAGYSALVAAILAARVGAA
jgi:lysophospholipase L1-like esterase